ncbi:MAG TPA: choice-of-anchor Q domain-containing protein [Flavisolibacter sp.]|nr:choice-of-anchor Q domain-containing protein [Flavisolibacter sp.]
MKKSLLIAFLSLITGQSLLATDYYVDAVNGNNASNGLTPATAFQTLAKVSYTATMLHPGDVVYIRNGTYGTTDLANINSQFAVLAITQSGVDGNPITFKAYPGESPLIQFNNWHGIYLQAAYIVIDGIRVRGNASVVDPTAALNQPSGCNDPSGTVQAKFNGNGITFDATGTTLCHHITVRNCEVWECCGLGIGGTKPDYITIESNKVYGNAWYSRYGTSGISLLHLTDYDGNTSTYRNIIRNNIVYDNEMKVPWYNGSCRGFTDGNGIIIDDANNGQSGGSGIRYAGKTLVENNIVYSNGGRGIHVFVTDNVTVLNNTAYQNNKTPVISDGEITIMSTATSQATGNRVYNNILFARAGKRISSVTNQASFSEDYNIMYNSSSFGYFNAHDIYADPRFVHAALFNFQLQSTSPAINTGTNAAGLFSATDIVGVVRPQGTLPDMGAYEFSGVVPTVAFTTGNLVALRVGDGTAALSTNMSAVNLIEYTTAGSATGVNVTLGDATSTALNRLTVGGANNTYEGQLSLSSDGRYLTAIGYDAAPGSSSATALAADKVIAKINANAQVDYGTRFSTAGTFFYNGNNVRSVVTDNGSRFWTTGSSTSNTRYIAAGATTTSINLSGGLRSLNLFNNRLYYAGAFNEPGYSTPDLPTSSAVFTTMPSTGTGISYQTIWLFDVDATANFNSTGFDLMYVTDVSSGLRKYYWNGTAWTAAGVFNPSSVTSISSGLFSMTGKKDGSGNPVLYVIKGAVSDNNLIQLTDASGYNGSLTTTPPTQVNVANAGTNYMFRGIAFSPSPTVIVLPVKLSSFKATLTGKDAAIQWSTAAEEATKEFIVEKSVDGISFRFIGSVAAKNNPTGYRYSFTDDQFTTKAAFYRLRTVDMDGKFSHSHSVRLAKSSRDAGLEVYPNPASENISVSHTKAACKAYLIVHSVTGTEVLRVWLQAGVVQTNLDVSTLLKGSYMLTYMNGNENKTTVFIKQ